MRDHILRLLSSSNLDDNRLGVELATYDELKDTENHYHYVGEKLDSRLYIKTPERDELFLLSHREGLLPVLQYCTYHVPDWQENNYLQLIAPLFIKS